MLGKLYGGSRMEMEGCRFAVFLFDGDARVRWGMGVGIFIGLMQRGWHI